jgi:hypothetical protein
VIRDDKKLNMDFEYASLRHDDNDIHNRCCGGRAWCVQVYTLHADQVAVYQFNEKRMILNFRTFVV